MLNIIIANGLKGYIDVQTSESQVHTIETSQPLDGSHCWLEFGARDLNLFESCVSNSLDLHHSKKKLTDLTMINYLDRLKIIFDKFVAIGEPLSYRYKIIHTFRGLKPEYNAIVFAVSARPDRPRRRYTTFS
ncbi:hypothetical protein PVL29_013490 [Vitis rotundifolia]|uniref:Uncharacterized protein n=1 Tax=Vitis rotundifolia TaxID=103349 RepID=A0AA39DPU8_VITRO|nr:hypothetical protein PVL29_013490 [Vitis rotundifolia]